MKTSLSRNQQSEPESLQPLTGLPELPQQQGIGSHFWLAAARSWAIESKDPIFRSGICAVRAGRLLAAARDCLPVTSLDTGSRRRHRATRSAMRLSAPAALVAQAARHGISLNGATAYLWPMFESAHCAALLIEAGCTKLVALDLPIPSRLEDDMLSIRHMVAECGVQLALIDPAAISDTFGVHSERHDSHDPDA